MDVESLISLVYENSSLWDLHEKKAITETSRQDYGMTLVTYKVYKLIINFVK